MRNVLFPILLMLLPQLQETVSGQITASIIGDGSEVCQGDSLEAFLYFSGGVEPWSVVINDNDGEYLILDSIFSPHTIWLNPDVDNSYYIASVKDSTGTPGNPLGEAAITVRQITPVTIVADRTAFLPDESGIELVSSPAGGAFSGPGVAGNVFYPSIATSDGSPHTISCIYTNQFGCISTDTIDLQVLSKTASVYIVAAGDTINAVCDDGATYYLRGSNKDSIPGSFELLAAGSEIPIPGHITDVDPLDNEATLDPLGLSGGYDIIYTYGLGEASVSSAYRFLVNDLGTIGISTLPDTVCKNAIPILLIPELIGNDPEATFSLSGLGISGNQSDGYYYNPSNQDVSVGKNELTLDYTSSNGCKAKSTIQVYNSFIPTVNFTVDAVCLPISGGTVSFTNLTSGKFSVERWDWDFGNPESGSNNSSTLEHPDHFYADPGYREIFLTATTYDGCSTSNSLDTILADQPVADFTWLNDCFIRSKRTAVLDRSVSTFAEIDTLIWTFKTNKGGVLGVIGSGEQGDTIEFPFTSIDQYFVELHVENEVGCPSDTVREIVLKPTIKLSRAGYEEDFDGESGNWLVASANKQESWTLGVPDFEGFTQNPGDLAWYTDLPGHTDGYLEQSWVQSPCFDFKGLSQPLIQLDLMKSFVPGTDGAVLQYQDLVSEGWKTIGKVGEGLNWYNEYGIYNEPGGNSFGWGLALFEPDQKWVNAGYSLDMLLGKQHVKFRLAVATGGAQEIESGRFNHGFAFDNFFIGDRHRYSVLEHFTNASDEASSKADEVVDAFSTGNSANVVNLQYHLDYPGIDAMNINNPYPPSTRSFYYGVPDVPYAVLNGGIESGTRYDFLNPSNEPSDNAVKRASLEIPLFSVVLQVEYLESQLEATVKVTCTADTFASNLQLYVAVMEREVTAYTGLNLDTMFRNVVLDMLPTAAGKLLGSEWYKGKSETRTFSWDYKEYVEDIEDLSVVAFVQDRDHGNVLQADAKPHTPGVGITHRIGTHRAFSVYPNPAVDHLFVNFGHGARLTGQIMIVDLSGKTAMQSDISRGYSIQRFDISMLSRGMYMIYWMDSGEVIGRKKLVFTR